MTAWTLLLVLVLILVLLPPVLCFLVLVLLVLPTDMLLATGVRVNALFQFIHVSLCTIAHEYVNVVM